MCTRICDVIFGELFSITVRDSETFEKSSSLFQGFLKFIACVAGARKGKGEGKIGR